MTKFFATIEFLFPQYAALVTLTNQGELECAFRVDLPKCQGNLASALYEEGYRLASATASSKGGRLERYRVVE